MSRIFGVTLIVIEIAAFIAAIAVPDWRFLLVSIGCYVLVPKN